MADYRVRVRSPWPAETAFAYMADLRNFAAWDPGVEASSVVDESVAAAQREYDVDVKGLFGSTRLRYRMIDYSPDDRVVVEAETTVLTSTDTITVEPEGDGCVVGYDARLRLRGVMRLGDPILSVLFRRIGDRAAAGLVAALDGQKLAESSA